MVLLGGALTYTGAYVFIYLARAFRVEGESPTQFVGLHHGDNFARTLLVAIFFLIGEVLLVYASLAKSRRRGIMTVRQDLWQWLQKREDLTGEPADTIAERAISLYRTRLEGGPDGTPSATSETPS
jgi:hypothetical protein